MIFDQRLDPVQQALQAELEGVPPAEPERVLGQRRHRRVATGAHGRLQHRNLGLLVKNTEAAGNLFAVAFPFGMISSLFAPPDPMPGWLGAVAAGNPVSSTAGAIRELFESPAVTSGFWIEQHAIAGAIVWPTVITAAFLPLAVRRFQRLSR